MYRTGFPGMCGISSDRRTSRSFVRPIRRNLAASGSVRISGQDTEKAFISGSYDTSRLLIFEEMRLSLRVRPATLKAGRNVWPEIGRSENV